MSVNFYWRYSGSPEVRLLTGKTVEVAMYRDDPAIHIGLYVSAGPSGQFNWAQEPDEVKRVLQENLNVAVVVDEYGRRLTGAEMLRWVEGTRTVLSIGEEFS